MRTDRLAAPVALIALLLLVSACGQDDGASAENTIEGIVTEVTGDLSEIESFVVMDSEGRSHFFVPEAGLLFYGGPLSHLRDHVVSGDRVVITFTTGADGQRTAVLIEHPHSDTGHDG